MDVSQLPPYLSLLTAPHISPSQQIDPPVRRPPSLTHLTLAPLTPSFPLPPTPDSPSLRPLTPTSYITPTSALPLAPSILSRSSSRTRLRPSFPSISNKNSKSHPDLLHRGVMPPSNSSFSSSLPSSRHHSRTPTASQHIQLCSPTPVPAAGAVGGYRHGYGYTYATAAEEEAAESWLIRTASTLFVASREEKGHGWLSARESSTSLRSPPTGTRFYDNGAGAGVGEAAAAAAEEEADDEYSLSPAWRTRSGPGSRMQSRAGSRAGSRADLRMTRTRDAGMGFSGAVATAVGRGGEKGVEGEEAPGPDFIGLEDEEGEAEQEGEVDEGEMRRLVWGRVGGWLDWALGWMDFRVEEVDGDEVEETIPDERKENLKQKREIAEKVELDEKDGEIRIPAPSSDEGTWEDAKWLLRTAVESF
ncbi:MAG: hypothetical protein LQ351_006462 [Letrouitia transgressa]|nr:MAG: hypothetical protein LQ351_006462 [Letrouitia transgressa]